MKNYQVTIHYRTRSGKETFFTCVVKGKKGYYRKAEKQLEKCFINMPEILDWWCDGSTNEPVGELMTDY